MKLIKNNNSNKFLITYKESNLPEDISGSKMTVKKKYIQDSNIFHHLPSQRKVRSCRVVGLGKSAVPGGL